MEEPLYLAGVDVNMNTHFMRLAILCVPHRRYAVPEILAAVVIGAWTLSFGVNMLFEARPAREDRAEA